MADESPYSGAFERALEALGVKRIEDVPQKTIDQLQAEIDANLREIARAIDANLREIARAHALIAGNIYG